jgi:hypothetical protein
MCGAVHKLSHFIDYTNAQVGKKLTQEEADELVEAAKVIIAMING